jgi:glutamate/tyrosine decarboxylase-like PLP-dependent enzyme
VDGAYGAPARLTRRGEEVLAGIERADSLVLDPHKWLFQHYEIGCVLVNHPGLLQHTFTLDGAYLRDTANDHVQLRERGPQLTRSSRALKLWLSLTTFGFDAFRDAIGHGIELAEHAEATLRAADGEIASPASLGVVTFHRPDVDSEALVRRITASGYAAPSTTILEGCTVARLCTINPRTTKRDIERTIERLEK